MTVKSPHYVLDTHEDGGRLFVGWQNRECGEHRTVGSHRAWCFDCSEWCYPRWDGACKACKGCRIPILEFQIESKENQRADAIRRNTQGMHTRLNSLEQEVARLRDVEAALARVRAIDPADHATSSRDYGRGYAQAIKDVREALEAT